MKWEPLTRHRVEELCAADIPFLIRRNPIKESKSWWKRYKNKSENPDIFGMFGDYGHRWYYLNNYFLILPLK